MNRKFSLWCDFIERGFLKEEFGGLLASGAFCGATSNPAIFASALKSPVYQEEIKKLKGNSAKSIYESLAIGDIKVAASLMSSLWEKDRDNGYISLEIDPFLGDKVGESVDEGKRLYQAIGAPNVMIKVPATEAGYEVMEALMSEGIAVNATLIFTKEQTQKCFEAFERGRRKAKGNQDMRGVISVFVSRFDRAVDSMLEAKMQARLGILNAQECYNFVEENHSPYTRILFASTGVKGDDLARDYYIESLIHPHSVNTAPLDTIKAYLANPNARKEVFMPEASFMQELAGIKQVLEQKGMGYETLAKKLLDEGLSAFEVAFEAMLKEL